MYTRRFPRIELSIPAVACLRDDFAIPMSMRQLSAGGCLLLSEEVFDSSRLLRIKFKIQDRDIDAFAKPLYCHTDDTDIYWGVSFEKLSFFSRYRLKRFINRHLKKSLSSKAPLPLDGTQ